MKWLKRIIKILVVFILIVVISYLLGPKVSKPTLDRTLPIITENLIQLENTIVEKEASFPVKTGNESKIIWYDSIPSKTPYSIVYLHGWSASREEGAPLHTEIANYFGFNAYLPRLSGHGLNEKEPMKNITADAIINSAKEAIAIAKKIGKKVIIMGTSTGGTLALHLAGGDPDIAGLLLFSPNVEIYDKNAKLLSGPWGLQLARIVKNGDYHEFKASDLKKRYWTSKYRIEALTHLQALIDNTMIEETFSRITQPTFVGYYYKNEEEQDKVISVNALLKMFETLETNESLKRKIAFPNVGDHVMTSYITSKDLPSVKKETIKFMEEILKLKPITN